jgi:hypothetical protein
LWSDTEQIEGALLDLGGPGEKRHCGSFAAPHGVACERSEVGEQRAEAVNRQAIPGSLGVGFRFLLRKNDLFVA